MMYNRFSETSFPPASYPLPASSGYGSCSENRSVGKLESPGWKGLALARTSGSVCRVARGGGCNDVTGADVTEGHVKFLDEESWM